MFIKRWFSGHHEDMGIFVVRTACERQYIRQIFNVLVKSMNQREGGLTKCPGEEVIPPFLAVSISREV